jgi:hypothetical protein
MILAICGLALVCAGVAVRIALGKGRNPVLWGVFGLLLSLVSLVVVTVLPASKAAGIQAETMPLPEVQAAA